MTAPTVINIRHAPADWRTNPLYLFIGRPSYLGNPFVLGRHGGRDAVIAKYREYLKKLRAVDTEMFDAYMEGCVRNSVLVCYCKPLACHGDVLIEWLNDRDEATGQQP